jgi:short-subunit dehydrogenase
MDRAQYGPWALIAGGSEGVGEAFARRLAAGGINLVLAARRQEPLQALAEALKRDHGVEVRTLALDLTAADLADKARAATEDIEVGLLVCNAGSGNPAGNLDPLKPIGGFLDRPLSDAQAMMALNISAMTQLTHHFGQAMRARGRGGIIIVGSTAAHAGTPRTLVYSAAKSFQFAFAEGLWYELRPHNVHVLGLILGAVKTPNLERTGVDVSAFGGGAEPEDVAAEAFERLAHGPVHHACGTDEGAWTLRRMPRAEAVSRVAEGIDAAYPPK